MVAKAQLTIDVTASTGDAVGDLKKVETAVERYGDAAHTATKQSRDVSGAIDSVGGVAGGATTGLRDMSDAIAMAGFPELAAGMQVAAVGLESLDGAATLYAAAQEGLTKAVGFFDGVLKFLRTTILTNPIFLMAAVVIAIGAAFVLAYKNCETFRNIVDGAVDAVWNTIKTVYNWVKDNWPLLLTILTGPFGLMVSVIIKHRDSIWDAIKAVYNWIRDTWDAVSGFLSAPIKAAWDTIKGIVDKITGAIQDVLDLIGKIKIPKGVTDFIGSINPFAVAPSPAAFAAPSVAARGMSSSSSSAAGGVTINVTGALDPDAVARQIDRILSGRSRRVGGVGRRSGVL